MASAAERVRAHRERRRAAGLREVRLVIPDARAPAVRARLAEDVRRFDRAAEEEAMRWIEAVGEFDEDGPRDAAR